MYLNTKKLNRRVSRYITDFNGSGVSENWIVICVAITFGCTDTTAERLVNLYS
jgi:hypothetical protein